MKGAVNIRRRLGVRGRVQGVGFRPFVYRLASELKLGGMVGNDTHGAFIEVEGPGKNIEIFIKRLQKELPPLAHITSLSERDISLKNESFFRIESSEHIGGQDVEITPDVSICSDCLSELLDPKDRRYRYPFINCTNCGPRYSIIQSVPYDRPDTTMSKFIMCPECQAEYDDPANRRFHAQPNACPECGPSIRMIDSDGKSLDGDPIRLCVELLRQGKVVAIKGIGGFHLACCADNDDAVAKLRERKSREAKPLAMMVGSLDEARELAEVDDASAEAMEDMSRPIVLMRKRSGTCISEHVAPNSDCFGIMLPYTPLHYLIFAEKPGPLVMTSGNPSEEPLCSDNTEAIERLSSIADAFLLHDRDIERRVDDSVVKVFKFRAEKGEDSAKIIPVRRARGFVPAQIKVPDRNTGAVLAVGAELKSAVCLLDGTEAVLSEHLGELTNPATYRNFIKAIDCFKSLLKLEPEIVAYDMHPDYTAARYARQLDLRKTEVQHHHAHIVSCMADNGITDRTIGIACDGTGYGTDGNIWGCEVLVCDEAEFERAGHLRYFPLLGGDSAARETWRPAAGLLSETFGTDWRSAADFAMRRVDREAIALAEQRSTSSSRIPMTSSLGRLFDAVAFLLGIRDVNRYEAEAAMAIEASANRISKAEPLNYTIMKGNGPEAPMLLDWRPMIRDIVDGVESGRSIDELARAFHETVALMLVDSVNSVAERTGLNRVALSGGCFANRILLERIHELLLADGRDVLIHDSVPPGDGGIALGQAVIAAERAMRGNI